MLYIPADPVAVPAEAIITPSGVNISSASVFPALSVGSSTAAKKHSMSDLTSSGVETAGHAVFAVASIILFGGRCPLRAQKT